MPLGNAIFKEFSVCFDLRSVKSRAENPPLVENLIENKGGVFGVRGFSRFWIFRRFITSGGLERAAGAKILRFCTKNTRFLP